MAVDRRHVPDGTHAVVGAADVRDDALRQREWGAKHYVVHQVVLLHREVFDGVDVLETGDVGEVAHGAVRSRGLDDTSMSASFARSPATVSTAPSRSRSAAVSATSARPSASMSVATAVTPLAAIASAVARPMPDPPRSPTAVSLV